MTTRRVRKGVKGATRVRKSKINPSNQIYKTFKASARVLGEVEAGMSALFDVLETSGLMQAPAGEVVVMTAEEAEEVLAKARAITDLLSHNAKCVIPVLLVAVGDPTAIRTFGLEPVRSEEETVH